MTLLAGRYRLEGLLGRGGMGEVYRSPLTQAQWRQYAPDIAYMKQC